MKSKFVFSSSSLFIGLFLFFFTENVCSQESADNWTLKQARQWTQKQEWANGLKAMPHKQPIIRNLRHNIIRTRKCGTRLSNG